MPKKEESAKKPDLAEQIIEQTKVSKSTTERQKEDDKRKKRKQKAKADLNQAEQVASLKETDVLHSATVGGNEKISMGDLFNSIDKDKYAANESSGKDG